MIRFFNGRLLSLDGGFAVTEQEVWVDGSKIAYVGPAKADMPAFAREIDLKGNLLMPGFKDAHTHSAMTFCRLPRDSMAAIRSRSAAACSKRSASASRSISSRIVRASAL